MYTSKYRYLLPNVVTFASLTCGIVAILLSATGIFHAAAVLILVAYVLDLLDGGLARKFNASSDFGLQLDSLVDMVSLGVAPAVLVFTYLHNGGAAMGWVWPAVVIFALAGAFRLARFNLLPVKEESRDSVGLTISTAGATPAITVLTNHATLPDWLPLPSLAPELIFVPLLLALALLMISTIHFPPFPWLFRRRPVTVALLASAGVSIAAFGFFNAWFIFNGGYLGVSLARAGLYRKY